MATTERFVRGPQPRTIAIIPVASATVVEKGDFVLIWQGNAITPASLGYIYSSATAARREARQLFAGIARSESASGETTPVQVDVSLESVYALDQCTAAAASVADLFGICAVSNASGLWGVSDQAVEPDCSYPVAVLMEEKLASGTRVVCKLLPGRLFNVSHSYTICDTETNMSYS